MGGGGIGDIEGNSKEIPSNHIYTNPFKHLNSGTKEQPKG